MIAVILGGSRSVWDDARAALSLIGDRPCMIVATNEAGARYPGALDAWASLHPDFFANALPRRLNAELNKPLIYAPAKHPDTPCIKVAGGPLDGSSALYAAHVAMEQLKAGKVILCGSPLDSDAGHIAIAGPWCDHERYRAGFTAALTEIKGRVRSMSGWTADTLGRPDLDWINAKA